jgi:hypothetical protein
VKKDFGTLSHTQGHVFDHLAHGQFENGDTPAVSGQTVAHMAQPVHSFPFSPAGMIRTGK